MATALTVANGGTALEFLLEVEGLKKSFGGVAALRDGRLKLRAGSVHALCGGNGAGKSTFLKILMGIYTRDDGHIRRRGKDVVYSSPAEALQAGIAIIEQELSPVPHMTVAENIYLGREPLRRFGGIDFKTMNRNAQKLLDQLEFNIRANQFMMNLSVAQFSSSRSPRRSATMRKSFLWTSRLRPSAKKKRNISLPR